MPYGKGTYGSKVGRPPKPQKPSKPTKKNTSTMAKRLKK